jgi:hypothetical protein
VSSQLGLDKSRKLHRSWTDIGDHILKVFYHRVWYICYVHVLIADGIYDKVRILLQNETTQYLLVETDMSTLEGDTTWNCAFAKVPEL